MWFHQWVWKSEGKAESFIRALYDLSEIYNSTFQKQTVTTKNSTTSQIQVYIGKLVYRHPSGVGPLRWYRCQRHRKEKHNIRGGWLTGFGGVVLQMHRKLEASCNFSMWLSDAVLHRLLKDRDNIRETCVACHCQCCQSWLASITAQTGCRGMSNC